MSSYFLSQKAIDDLTEIWEYTFETWSEHQADTYYFGLVENCKNLPISLIWEEITPKSTLTFLATNQVNILFFTEN